MLELNTMNTNRGFAIIESLVVVAIITLLLAILAPCLKGAKDAAKEVVFTNDIKQDRVDEVISGKANIDTFAFFSDPESEVAAMVQERGGIDEAIRERDERIKLRDEAAEAERARRIKERDDRIKERDERAKKEREGR